MYKAPKAELVRFEAFANGGGNGEPVGGGSGED